MSRLGDDAGHFHAVNFYESRESLCRLVAGFLSDGLVSRQPVLVIATPEHRAGVVSELAARHFNIDALQAAHALLLLDAEEVLATFMVDGMPSEERFFATMTPVLQQLCRERTDCTIRVYGEMVDVLWKGDQKTAAIRLEVLWNKLAMSHSFALLCGYSMGSFDKDASLAEIDHVHSHVVTGPDLAMLSRRLLDAQERERASIARELHDDFAQRIVTLAMQLHNLAEEVPSGATEDALREMYGHASDLGRDIQSMSHRLHSSRLQFLGIASEAARLCKELSQRLGVEIAFSADSIREDMPADIVLALFRVLQEALANALKHSSARNVDVVLRGGPDDIQLEIVDAGIGFDPHVKLRTEALGLISMRERVALVNGTISIESEPGRWTAVRVRVPMAISKDAKRLEDECLPPPEGAPVMQPDRYMTDSQRAGAASNDTLTSPSAQTAAFVTLAHRH